MYHFINTLPHLVQTFYIFLHLCLSVVFWVKCFLVSLQRRDHQFFKVSAQFSTQHLHKVAIVDFEILFLGHERKKQILRRSDSSVVGLTRQQATQIVL